ncbi:glycosyltransferase family 2 protein [Nocardioides sp. YIM 152588]|uniref:glycosyltransferase family 2 protein n=1 Tax=Nocardioides sp. YIM 152588 TaxID=3158259 RepID=UPI0032E3C80C
MRIRRPRPAAGAATTPAAPEAGLPDGAAFGLPERVPFDGSDGALPRVAAITMARDEGAMIRRWAEHYAAQLGAENVFVVDDHSTDGSTDDLPATVLRLPYLDKFGFEQSRLGILNNLASAFLFAYDAVLSADADEFVVADPVRHAGLREFVATTAGRDVVGVLGYNVVQDLANEKPLDFDRPLLSQRSYAKFMPLMCKPMLKWAAVPWARASHGVRAPYEIDTDLFMFHFKFADLDLLAARAGHRNALNETENRAAASSWSRSADVMVDLMKTVDQQIATPSEQQFRPRQRQVDRIVQPKGPNWKAVGPGQVQAMETADVLRIPPRFRDLV